MKAILRRSTLLGEECAQAHISYSLSDALIASKVTNVQLSRFFFGAFPSTKGAFQTCAIAHRRLTREMHHSTWASGSSI